ncbi:MAG: efflux RND transporter periplasmic adaptor subunit [Candidatus Tenebribacter burtonii]|nr:efflux RND transporter periplasmic adaptor subunit [Candidatus Tenebribacter burtonii]
MKKIWLIIFVIVLIGSGAYYLISKKNGSSETEYEFTEITRGDLENLVSCTGTLEAVGAVEVGTELSGTVSKVFADYNDDVKKNQILAILDTTQLAINLRSSKADLIRTKAQYELSKKEYENDLKLFEQNYISELELEISQTAMKTNYAGLLSAEANFEKAELNINKYSVIRSPITGKVIDRSIEEGQTVAASFSSPTLFYIAENLQNMEIYANVDESDIGMIKTGMQTVFTVEAYPDDSFEGVVKQIRLQPETISNVVNYTVVVETSNDSGLLLPGMTATIDFIIEQKKDVLLVSRFALTFTPDESTLMEMMQKRRAEREKNSAEETTSRPQMGKGMNPQKMKDATKLWYLDDIGDLQMSIVETGSTDGSKIEIVSGKDIEAGMQVISKQTTASKSSSNNSSNMRMMRPF